MGSILAGNPASETDAGDQGGVPLAFTGSGPVRWVSAGLLLLAGGLVAVAGDRRRRRPVVSNRRGPSC